MDYQDFDDLSEITSGRTSTVPPGSEVEGFNEDFSQMLRSHFREKSKAKKITQSGPLVTFSFVVSISTPLSADRLVELEAKAAKRKNQGGLQANVDPSAAIAHVHTEYAVLPGDNPLKTDVIFYATAARIFPDRHEPKTVKTWWADGHLWCSWTHSHTVLMSDALVHKLTNHTIDYKIWDSREKLSQRAKMDRPRGFRASELEGHGPSGAGGSISSLLGIAAGIVITQTKLFTQDQPRQLLIARPFGQTIKKHAGTNFKTEMNIQSEKRKENASPVPTESKSSDVVALKVIPEPGHQLRDYSQVAQTARASADFEELKRRKRLAVAYRYGQTAYTNMLHQGSVDSEKRDNVSSVASKQNSNSKKLRPGSTHLSGEPGSHLMVDAPGSEMSNKFSHQTVGIGGELRSSMASVTTMTGVISNLPQPSGIVQSVKIRTANLYDGRKSTTCRINQPAGLVSDCMLTLIVDPSLLTENQTILFRPVILRVVSAGPLPANPTLNNPAYCRCLIPDFSPNPIEVGKTDESKPGQSRAVEELLEKEKIAQRKQHEAELISFTDSIPPQTNNTVYWNYAIAILTGDIPEDALRQNLLQRPLVVELHDREMPIPSSNATITSSTTTLNSSSSAPAIKPAVFGSLPNDNQLASSAVLPPPPPEPPKPPFGQASILINDLLISHTGKGLTFCEGTAVVKPKRPQPPSNASETTAKKPPLPKYLEHGTSVKISARAPIPIFAKVALKPEIQVEPQVKKGSKSRSPSPSKITTPQPPKLQPPPPPPELLLQADECISILVVSIPRMGIFNGIDAILENMVRSVAVDCNSEALALAGIVEPDERAAALTAYQLAPEQQIDKNLNLVTGFHMADEDGVIIAVEGFPKVISRLWEDILAKVHEYEQDNQDEKIAVFYNSSLLSPIRRYGALDLSYPSVSLGRGISVIVAEPLLYVRDMAPSLCRDAAVKISTLRNSASSISDIVRRSLLPTADELKSLFEEFSVKSDTERTFVNREASYLHGDVLIDEMALGDNIPDGNAEVAKPRDYIRENMERIWAKSYENVTKREQAKTISIAVNTGHVYSSHSVNAVEIAKAHIRDKLLLDTRRYTYSQDYHHRTFLPLPPSPEKLSIYSHARQWQYPGHIDAIQANQHSRLPDKARLDELAEPWRENWLHVKYLNPPLPERDPLPWELHRADFNLVTKPYVEQLPESVFQPGDAAEYPLECLAPLKDRRLRTHRRGVRSEQEDCSHNMSILDRVSDMLHDPPAKVSLKYKSTRNIPRISQLAADFSNKSDKNQAFGPRFYNDWLLDRNTVPLKPLT